MGTQAVGISKFKSDTPVLLVDLDKLERNITRMASLFREARVNWRPHVGGQRVPAIAHLQMAVGAIGVACDRVEEAEVVVSAGIKDVLITSQIVGPGRIARFVNLSRRAAVIATVDSVQNVRDLDAAAQEKEVRPRVVVEVNVGMDCSGVEPGTDAVALSREVARSKGLRYIGLIAHDGHMAGMRDNEEKRNAVERAVGLLTMSAGLCREAGLPVEVVSCGGSGTYWITTSLPGVTEIQAGTAVFHDEFYADAGDKGDRALTVLATVLSRPTQMRIVVDGGRDMMSVDVKKPHPMDMFGVNSIELSANRSTIILDEPTEYPRVGDLVELIVGYAESTVPLNYEMHGTRNGLVEVVWPIMGRDRFY